MKILKKHRLLCQVILAELTLQEKLANQNKIYQNIYGSLEQQMMAIKLFSSLLAIQKGCCRDETLVFCLTQNTSSLTDRLV